jgi:hypothetical protein
VIGEPCPPGDYGERLAGKQPKYDAIARLIGYVTSVGYGVAYDLLDGWMSRDPYWRGDDTAASRVRWSDRRLLCNAKLLRYRVTKNPKAKAVQS